MRCYIASVTREIIQFGTAEVLAENEDEALTIASRLHDDQIEWVLEPVKVLAPELVEAVFLKEE